MLFDDDEWLQCPDHRKLKAWKKQPGGGWLQYFLEASEFPHHGGDGTAWEMGHAPLGAWSSWLWPGNWTKTISVWSVMTREEDFCDKGRGGGGSSDLKGWAPPGGSRLLSTSRDDTFCHCLQTRGEEEM